MKIVIADRDSVGTDMDYSIYDELGEVTYYDDKVNEDNAKERLAEYGVEIETAGSGLYHCGRYRAGRSGRTVPAKRWPADPVRGRSFPSIYHILVCERRKDVEQNCA